MTHESQFQDYFEFPSNDVEQMRATPYEKWECNRRGNNCKWVQMYKSAKSDRYFPEEYWYRVGIMGSHHIQTSTGVIFNTPRAIKRKWTWPNKTGRFQGTIVHRDDSKTISINHKRHPFFVVAEGNWWNSYDVTYDAYVADPHWYDQTGASFAKGNFFKFNQDLEHFVVGAPNADRLQGRVYICHDCFGTKSKRNGRQLQAPNPQHGERFGAAVAAVDIKGDGYGDVVVGAPLPTQLSKVLTNLQRMFFLS